MFYYITFRERCTGIVAPGKNAELIYKFWDSQAFSRNSADLDKTDRLFFFNIYEGCPNKSWTFVLK